MNISFFSIIGGSEGELPSVFGITINFYSSWSGFIGDEEFEVFLCIDFILIVFHIDIGSVESSGEISSLLPDGGCEVL